MAPSGATLMPGSVTFAPGMATGAMNGPDAPAVVVAASPASAEAAMAMTAAMAAMAVRELQRCLTAGERRWVLHLAQNFCRGPLARSDGTIDGAVRRTRGLGSGPVDA